MGTYQVTWKWRWLLQECRNTFYYVTSVGEPSAAEWIDCVDEIRNDIDTEWKIYMSDDCVFWGMDYRRVDTAGLLSFEAIPTSGDLVGTSATDDLPTQIALLVSVKGTTVKPNRARTYLPGTTEGWLTDSLFGSTVQGAGEDLIGFQSNLNTGGTNPLSRVAAQWNSSHTQVIATNDLSGASPVASAVPATQRRRRIGRGI